MYRILLILFLALGGLGLPGLQPLGVSVAQAQDAAVAVDYEAWQQDASRAENAVESALASSAIFEQLRGEIAVWRERFLQAQNANAARIRTLRSQIAALGDPPAEGATESPEIASLRSDLNAQLSEAQAPVKRAEEAFSRADGLVREIDGIIRERQTNALLELGPSPLNPVLWPGAVTKLFESMVAVGTEVTQAWRSDLKRATLRSDLPITLLYLLIAIILLMRGRSLMERITGWVLESSKGRARVVAGFITSLGQIILPVLGIYLLVAALKSTGMLGMRGLALSDTFATLGMMIFGARWLALRLFPRRAELKPLIAVAEKDGVYLRFYITSLGVMIGLMIVLNTIADNENFEPGVWAVLAFPLALLIAFLLFRIGRLLRRTAQAIRGDSAADEPAFGARVMGLVGRAVMLMSVLGAVFTAVGYFNAGFFLLLPVAFSLALVGLLVVLTDLIAEIYVLLTGIDSAKVSEALIPTLLSLVLVLLSLPAFALIWGARIADLTELWTKFQEGFDVGGTRISPTNFLTFTVVFITLYVATRLVQSAMRTSVLPKTKMDTGGKNAVISGIGYIGIFLAALVAITTAGIDLSSLAIVAGALSVGIGFGLQNIVSNFVSGIILLIERPISQGDWIEVGGHTGIVRDISVRSTRLETFDRVDVIVPNADFVSGSVQNWTRGNSIGRVIVPVGVAYGNDTRRVQKILEEIAHEHPLVTLNPAPGVDFLGFGADSLDFRIRAVISDVNFSVPVKTEMNHRIAERFAEEGIEIPFAQRDIWLRNPEVLKDNAAKPVDESETEQSPVETASVGEQPVKPVNNPADDEDEDDAR